MVEYICVHVLHVAINRNAEAFVWFISAKDTEVKHSKAAKVPFMGIMVFNHHLAGKFFCHGFDKQVAERRGLFQDKQIFFNHSAY